MPYFTPHDRPVGTPHGLARHILPFFKWRRPDGRASFFMDRLALRKSLSLCMSCERNVLPRRWELRYDYQKITQFHGDGVGCDYCRDDTTTSLYIPMEGSLAGEYNVMEPSVRNTRARERHHAMQYGQPML